MHGYVDKRIRGYAVENTPRIVSVIRPKHSRRILAFIQYASVNYTFSQDRVKKKALVY